MIVLFILIAGLFALWTAHVAKKNGRDPWIAGVFGFLFGILAVIAYAIAGKTEEKEIELRRKAQQ